MVGITPPNLTDSINELSKRVVEMSGNLSTLNSTMSGPVSPIIAKRGVQDAAVSAAMGAAEMNLSTTSIRSLASQMASAVTEALSGEPLGSVPTADSGGVRGLLGPDGRTLLNDAGAAAAVPLVESVTTATGTTDVPAARGSRGSDSGNTAVPAIQARQGRMGQPTGRVLMSNPYNKPGLRQAGAGMGGSNLVDRISNGLVNKMTMNTPHTVSEMDDGTFGLFSRGGQQVTLDASSPTYDTAEAAQEALSSAAPSRASYMGASALSGMGGEGGMAGGALRGLAETVGLADPVVDAAVAIPAAVIGAGDFMSSQRQANAQYQGIYGGSNISGLGQRFDEEAFRFGNFGTLSSGQASQLFNGVSQLGLQGSQRTNALNVAVGAYKQQGTSLDTSLAAISTAVQSGNADLNGLADAITTVSKAAKDAGLNVGVTAQAFTQNYQTLANGNLNGQGATALAAGVTAGTANLGRMGAGLGAAVSQAIASPMVQTLVAAQNGMTGDQLQYMMDTDPTKAAKLFQDYVGQAVGLTTPTAKLKKLAQQVKARGGNRTDNVNTIIAEGTKDSLFGNGTPQTLVAGASALGLNVTERQAEAALAGYALNQIEPTAGLTIGQSTAAAAGGPATSGGAILPSGITSTTMGLTGPKNYWSKAQLAAWKKGEAAIGYHPGNLTLGLSADASTNSDSGGVGSGSPDKNIPLEEYLQDVTAKGKYDPILARLLQTGAYKHEDYQVDVGGGKHAIVNSTQLIAHFADQVQTGQAKMDSGGQKGYSVADRLRMQPTGKAVQGTATGADLRRWGVDEQENLKEGQKEDRREHTTTDLVPGSSSSYIDLSPAAKKFFTLSQSMVTDPSQNAITQRNVSPAKHNRS
jgi:hypothetical protein